MSTVGDLTNLFGCTRTQAERLQVNARRLLKSGHNPTMRPGDALGRSVAATEPRHVAQEDTEHQAPSIEDEAQSMARRIRGESSGVAGASVANLRSRLAVCERNILAGYPEWSYQARLLRRTLELVEVPF